MSRKVPSPSFNSLTRYHSAPGSFMSNMNVDEEDSVSHLHGSSNPSTRADAILTSLFSDDLTAWPQKNGAGGPVHMFHQFPILDEHNNLMPKQPDPNKPTLGMEKSIPGKLPHELASGSKEAGPSQFAALAYTNMICADEFVFDQGPRSRWKLREDESNETIILAQHQLPNSSKGLIRTSSPQQSSSPAQFFKYFSDTQIPEEVREQRKCPRTSHVPKSLAKNLIEDLSETLDSPRIELNGCGEVDNEKCSTLDNFSSVTGTSPTSKKHFRSITTDSSSADILLDGGLQEQTCISFSKQELPPSNFTPCQSRAKRGHATHPRSIAERVRRTRISERIKKLQDLVPNLDKQINTADMLDEVVDYVKFLQKQVQELSKDCPPKVD